MPESIARQAKTRRESKAALRLAWPNRHTHPMRAGIVIRSNVAMLRKLAEGGAS